MKIEEELIIKDLEEGLSISQIGIKYQVYEQWVRRKVATMDSKYKLLAKRNGKLRKKECATLFNAPMANFR